MLFAHTEPINYWVLSLKIVPGPRAMPLWHVHNPSHTGCCVPLYRLVGKLACRLPSPQYGSQLWSTLSSRRNSAYSPPFGMTAAVRCTNSAHIDTGLLCCPVFVIPVDTKDYGEPNKNLSCRNNTTKKVFTGSTQHCQRKALLFKFKFKILIKWFLNIWITFF